MSDLLNKVENFVIKSFSEDGILSSRGKHSLKTKECLLKICPNANIDLQLASLLHDIEASVSIDKKSLKDHQENSAKIAKEFLIKNGCKAEDAIKIAFLINKHEVGGSIEQNLLKDADSLSFFEGNLNDYIASHNYRSKEQIKEKVEWMYERITLGKAKELARPMYEQSIRLLKSKEDGESNV